MSYLQTLTFYLRMARPTQLVAVILVYSWGILLALPPDASQLLTYLIGLLALLLASASIHYANEYADFGTDALTVRTPFSGGSGALKEFGAPRETALKAAKITLAPGLLLALGATVLGLLPRVALLILALGALGDWMYSLPPLKLAWRGWGELVNAFLGGMLLPTFGFSVVATRLDWRIFLLTLPFMLFVFANLLATTWADRYADREVGKLTLATRWPANRLRRLYFLAVVTAYILTLFLRNWLLPGPLVWLLIPLLFLTLWAGYSYTRRHSPFPSVLVMVLFLLFQLGVCLVTPPGTHALALAG